MPKMRARANWHGSVTEEAILDAVERQMIGLDNPAFCLNCGAENDGEPDMRGGTCESCGHREVYGVEELLPVIA